MSEKAKPKAAAAPGAGLQLLEDRLRVALADDESYRLDPLTLLMLISVILPLIQDCFVRLRRDPGVLRQRLFNRSRLAFALRRQGLGYADAYRLAGRAFDAADSATDDELRLVIDDCGCC